MDQHIINPPTPDTVVASSSLGDLMSSPVLDDLELYEFQVKVTYLKLDETEVFDTLEHAKAFATDKLKDARVAKVAIKKVTPEEEGGEGIEE